MPTRVTRPLAAIRRYAQSIHLRVVCDPDVAPPLRQILGPEDRWTIMVSRPLFVKACEIRIWWSLIIGHGECADGSICG